MCSDIVDEVVAEKFACLTFAELSDRLLKADIAFGALNSVKDLADHTQLRTSKGIFTTSNGKFSVKCIIFLCGSKI